MSFRLNPLAFSIKLAVIGSCAFAAEPDQQVLAFAPDPDQHVLEEIRVTAVSVAEDANRIASPFSVISSEALAQRGGATLGDALNGLPGVHSDTFGGGASRPVVRGQTAPRVQVLSNGSSVFDASSISPDHAITAEPLLAEQVEVLRGPAALLYGGGAIGGVVNVVDNKIPTAIPEKAAEGFIAIRGNTVADEGAGAVSITTRATDNIALHFEGMRRHTDDYRVSDWDHSRVAGSGAESDNVSAGISWIGDRGYLGLAYSYRSDEYGLPGHSHEYESCHPHGSALHCGGHDHDHDHDDDQGHAHDHEAVPFVDLVSRRVDLRGELQQPFAGVERLLIRASHTDYRHDEIEHDEISTRFTNKGYEGRIELHHVPVGGWHGVVGLQHADTEFAAEGLEAFLPTTETRHTGLFVVEHLELNEQWHFELGARYEQQRLKPLDDPRARPESRMSATAFSGAAIWEFRPDYTLTASLSRSQRLPHAQEMYARGVHLATNTYECGLVDHPLTCGGVENNAGIEKETSQNLELLLRKNRGDMTFFLSAFYNEVDNYIYARTLDRHEDFRLIKYTQRDARFIGLEGELTYRFNRQLSATLFGDYVQASFRDSAGGDLPRIPSARLGGRINGTLANFTGELEYYHVGKQNDVADYEEKTPGYDMLNLTLSYGFGEDQRYKVFLRGGNLLDEQIWNHTSFLANVVPLPGRNLSAGLRVEF